MDEPVFLSATESAFFQSRITKTMDNAVRDIDDFLNKEVRALLAPRAKRIEFNNYESRYGIKSPKFETVEPSKTRAGLRHSVFMSQIASEKQHSGPAQCAKVRRDVTSEQKGIRCIAREQSERSSNPFKKPTNKPIPSETAAHTVRDDSVHVPVEKIVRVLPTSPSPHVEAQIPAKRKLQKTPLIKSTNLDLDDSMDLEQRMRRNYENRIHQTSPQAEALSALAVEAPLPDAQRLRDIQERRKSMEQAATAVTVPALIAEPELELVVDPKKMRLCNNLFSLIACGATTVSADQILQFIGENKLHQNCVSDLQRLAADNPAAAIDAPLFASYILKNLCLK